MAVLGEFGKSECEMNFAGHFCFLGVLGSIVSVARRVERMFVQTIFADSIYRLFSNRPQGVNLANRG